MVKVVDNLAEQALSLSPRSRARLASRLLSSLDDPKIDKLWVNEVEDRLDAVLRGELKPISGTQVFRRLRVRAKK